MLTPRGVGLGVGAVLTWGIGRLLGVAELYVIAATAGAALVAGVLLLRSTSTAVSVRRGLSTTRLRNGGTAEVTLQLRNDARVTSPVLLVEDTCPWTLAERPAFVVDGLRPSTSTVLRYEVVGTARGRYRVGPVRLRLRDPLGVIQQTRGYTATDELVVLPVVERLPDGIARGTHRGSGSSDSRRLFVTGDEFHTMREYVRGDDLRLVHWPSTARRQQLMVRQQEQPWQVEATLLLDGRARAHTGAGPTSTFEKAVSVTATVVWHLADHGYRLRLIAETDSRPRGPEGWDGILDRLAEIETSATSSIATAAATLRRCGPEGLLVAILTPPRGSRPVAQDPEVRALLHAARGHAGRAAIVVHAPGEAARADELVAMLRVGGWRAVAVHPGQPLADRWPDLLGARPTVAAYQPDPV